MRFSTKPIDSKLEAAITAIMPIEPAFATLDCFGERMVLLPANIILRSAESTLELTETLYRPSTAPTLRTQRCMIPVHPRFRKIANRWNSRAFRTGSVGSPPKSAGDTPNEAASHSQSEGCCSAFADFVVSAMGAAIITSPDTLQTAALSRRTVAFASQTSRPILNPVESLFKPEVPVFKSAGPILNQVASFCIRSRQFPDNGINRSRVTSISAG